MPASPMPSQIKTRTRTADEATRQVLTKDYAVRFVADPRPVYAVGLNISSDRRTIGSYEVLEVKKD